MPTLGKQLLQPESGWKRYNFTQLPFDFISDKWEVLSYSEAYGGEGLMFPAKISPQSLKFKFYGDRIRILIRAHSSYSPSTTIKIDDITYSMANNYNCDALFNIIGFEKIFENGNKWREVEIITGKDGYNYLFNVILDAIDINKDGFVKLLLFLIKQNDQYYTIKSEFYKNGNYESITELEGKEILNQTDFGTFGIDDLNLLTKTIDTQVINGIDKGGLDSGKYFEFGLNNDIKKISNSDKIYSTEIIEDFQEDNKFNFDGRWQIITGSDSNIKNYLFSTPPGSYKSSDLIFKCKCKKIKFKYKLTYTSGHGSYSFTVDEQKLNIDCSNDWRTFEMQFDNDVEHEFKFSLNNDGEYTRLCIDNISILTMTNKQLIQYNNTIYTFDEDSIKLSPSQELNEDNFKVNGFNDATAISSEQWNKIFPNKKNVKILMLANDIEKQQCEMIYNCEPFRPIDKLKKNSDICNILFKEV
ncbi:hypothetical protein ACFLKB_17350 [Clostridium sp. FAM 1755]|uniref:hypothetical protein n=1 Tax=Clostridium caseinilyticum TaxID=3350403 RepID=UPI0038F6B49D